MKLLAKIKYHIPPRLRFVLRYLTTLHIKIFDRRRIDLFLQQENKGFKNIPVYIISFNRLSYLKEQIAYFEKKGINNIHIIDNASTYPPLLDYYNTIQHEVIFMKSNEGHKVFWENDMFSEFRESFYIVTDPDIIPVDECPDDFIEVFFKYLKKYPFVRKIGFSLKLDDIPLNNVLADEAISWESKYYDICIEKGNLYFAPIDTTFALYLPDKLVKKQTFYSAFRTAFPYQACHLPWYKDNKNITDEDIFYSQNKTNGWWDNINGSVTPDDVNEYLNIKTKSY